MWKISRKLRKFLTNIKLILLVFITAMLVLVATPQLTLNLFGNQYRFSGIEPQILHSKVQSQIRFAPSLDFYENTRVIVSLTGLPESVSPLVLDETLKQYESRLRASGIGDYELAIRQKNGSYELEIDLPKPLNEVGLFSTLIGMKGTVTFANRADQEAGSENTQTQLNEVPLGKTDIEGVELVYGSDTNGWGLVIDFKDQKVPELLVYGASNYNTKSTAGLILQIDGSPVAGQAIMYSSNSLTGKMVFATNLGNDSVSANLLRTIVYYPALDYSGTLNSDSSVEFNGKYTNIADYIKGFIVLSVLCVSAYLVFKKKRRGVAEALTLLFVLSAATSVAKILNLQLMLASIAAVVLAITIWYVHLVTNKSGKTFNRYLLLSTILLIIINNWQIPVVTNFSLYFVTTIFCGWLGLTFAWPMTNLLLTDND